jgi:hypothetical protein
MNNLIIDEYKEVSFIKHENEQEEESNNYIEKHLG